ncbi:16S rRNA (guanine(527)-N(7))-methyltransferase RsmG [Crocinitomicaceae bacterium]|nr:16S rRNA (guanine(527)-N(7))-methyltransferase RsmG [Crocinitomicaceae bacterium]
MDLIKKYFPDIPKEQYNQLKELKSHYEEWNQKINVISRKDIDNFYERHVLHSLAIAKLIQFRDDSTIIDVGTGGGFPGVPLAILFPNAHFTLLDSIGKKLKVINEISEKLHIDNIETIHSRVETIDRKYDYILSRAVTNLPKFIKLTRNIRNAKSASHSGIYYLKGGDFEKELKQIKEKSHITDLNSLFEEEFFITKKLIHIPY